MWACKRVYKCTSVRRHKCTLVQMYNSITRGPYDVASMHVSRKMHPEPETIEDNYKHKLQCEEKMRPRGRWDEEKRRNEERDEGQDEEASWKENGKRGQKQPHPRASARCPPLLLVERVTKLSVYKCLGPTSQDHPHLPCLAKREVSHLHYCECGRSHSSCSIFPASALESSMLPRPSHSEAALSQVKWLSITSCRWRLMRKKNWNLHKVSH